MNCYKFLKRDTNCIKALAIMMMLFHHLFTFPEKLKDGAGVNSLYTFSDGRTLECLLGDFGKLCVAIFMLLSGYGVYKSFCSKNGNYTSIIMCQIKNVYIKFWQVFVVFVLIGAWLGAENISMKAIDWIKNFFAIETTFNAEWWFLTQ